MRVESLTLSGAGWQPARDPEGAPFTAAVSCKRGSLADCQSAAAYQAAPQRSPLPCGIAPASTLTSHTPRPLAPRSAPPDRDRISLNPMKNAVVYSLCLCLCAPVAFPADNTGPLRGYSNDSARSEREWEAKFRVPSGRN